MRVVALVLLESTSRVEYHGGVVEEEGDAPSATLFHGFRLPSLRDCAGMTGEGVQSISGMRMIGK